MTESLTVPLLTMPLTLTVQLPCEPVGVPTTRPVEEPPEPAVDVEMSNELEVTPVTGSEKESANVTVVSLVGDAVTAVMAAASVGAVVSQRMLTRRVLGVVSALPYWSVTVGLMKIVTFWLLVDMPVTEITYGPAPAHRAHGNGHTKRAHQKKDTRSSSKKAGTHRIPR